MKLHGFNKNYNLSMSFATFVCDKKKNQNNSKTLASLVHQWNLCHYKLGWRLLVANGAIFLRWFRLYMLSFMFRFMFANICNEKNQNSKIHVMFIINIT